MMTRKEIQVTTLPPMTPSGEGGVPADITLTIPLMVIFDIRRLYAHLRPG